MDASDDIRKQLDDNRRQLEELRANRAAQAAERLRAITSPATPPEQPLRPSLLFSQPPMYSFSAMAGLSGSSASDTSVVAIPPPPPQPTTQLPQPSPQGTPVGGSGISAQRKLEIEHVINWALETMTTTTVDEATERAELYASFIHSPIVTDQWRHLRALHEEYATDVPLSKAASMKVIALLRADSSTATSLLEADEDGSNVDDALYRSLKQYRRDRDFSEEKLRESLQRSKEIESELRASLDATQAANRELLSERDRLRAEMLHFQEVGEKRISELVAMKDTVVAVESERAALLRAVADLEQQVHEASSERIAVLRKQEERELKMLAACKDGEARAIKLLQDENAALRLQHAQEIQRHRDKKRALKEQFQAMKVVFDECVAARGLLQSELLELQNAKADVHARIASEVARVREEANKEIAALRRRLSEMKRVAAEKEQMLNVLRGEVALGVAPTAATPMSLIDHLRDRKSVV